MSAAPSPAGARCSACGTELPSSFLACPACHRLVHAERLQELAAEAERATRESRPAVAVAVWRQALALLPPGVKQGEVIGERIADLVETLPPGVDVPVMPVEAAAAPMVATAVAAVEPGPPQATRAGSSAFSLKRLAPLGALALLLWKFKALAVFSLSKGKLLLLGLTKSGTLLSMLASFAVYWGAWGWRFALGLVGAMYVHEMGHVAALARLGIPASPPMFVPGLGAFVRMKSYPATPREDAQVGLAGPLWGLGASLFAFAVHLVSVAPVWAAIAHTSAWLNLFNLLPLGPLDGGRGFRALSRGQRWLAAASLGVGYLVTGDGLALLLAIVAAFRALTGAAPARGDGRALSKYALLALALAGLCRLSASSASPV